MIALASVLPSGPVPATEQETPASIPGEGTIDYAGPDPKFEKAVREEGLRQLAEAYCEKIGSGDTEYCYEAVANGDVAPEDIFEPDYPDPHDGYGDSYGGGDYGTYP